MTIKDIESKVDERIKEGTPFSRQELMREYLKIYRGCITGDLVIDYAKKYDINIQNPNSRLYKIFKYLKTGKRFLEKDVIWLIEKDFMQHFSNLSIEYNIREAEFYLLDYKKRKNLWSIVNASSHFRKANKPAESINTISKLNFKAIRNLKLKSALLITQGGAYRDLKNFDEALKCAKKGYDHDLKSYYPCTLFGAVYYEKGNYQLGAKWYLKAERKGASIKVIENEIKSIYNRKTKKEKEELKKYLLNSDNYYTWL